MSRMVSASAKEVIEYTRNDEESLLLDTFGRFMKTNSFRSTPLKDVSIEKLCVLKIFVHFDDDFNCNIYFPG